MKPAYRIALAAAAFWIVAAAAPAAPMQIGIDLSGDYHLGHTNIEPWSHPPFWQAIDELGGQFLVAHLYTHSQFSGPPETPESMLAKILRIDAAMRLHGRRYLLDNDIALYELYGIVYPGINEFDAPGGCHRWDLRSAWRKPLLDANATSGTAFLGWVYDEADNSQINGNRWANDAANPIPPASYDAPYLANVNGLTPAAAWNTLTAAATSIRTTRNSGQVPLFSEEVTSDQFQLFAAAGWTVTPKLLMVGFSAVQMAGAMGAVLEYADRTHLWTMLDMHGWLGFPGWSPEAVRSAMTMAYWLGAEGLYVENLDWVEDQHRAGTDAGGLIRWSDQDHYALTQNGAVFQDFAKNYLPSHPRSIDWRDYRPRVAIVRLPDGDYGMDGQVYYRNRLLGIAGHPSDAQSKEWLKIWPILTHGALKPEADSMMNDAVYPEVHNAATAPDFFVPIDSVAVFDHNVAGPVLDSVDCFVVCGHALSAATFADIGKRVDQQGATCIIARDLFNLHPHAGPLGPGWLVVDSFDDPRIATTLAPFLGEPGVARFRFKNAVVEFRPGDAGRDSIKVRVLDKTLINAIAASLLGAAPPPDGADVNNDGKTNVADLVALIRLFNPRRLQ